MMGHSIGSPMPRTGLIM